MNEETSQALETRESGDLQTGEGTRPGPVFTPAVDIFETESSITVLADLPGVTPGTLTIDLDDGVLTITGHSEDPEAEGESDVFREYRSGTFRRTFTLSEIVDQAGIDARLTDGVLRLDLPKVEKAKPTRIQVTAGD